ncbi:hypothetical protein QYF36_019274 [Acer negundo]|nr:hypothetical protein QYF36_007540 [Acer negundo]KAK4848968.1 hypothetical protein QYF36_019274 [Acer negundo]
MEISTNDSITIHASASLAYTGNLSTSFLSQFNSAPWVIDSGASDHMTNISSLFNIYSPCSGNKKVCIADDSLSSIAGTVVFSPTLCKFQEQTSGTVIGSAKMHDELYYFEDSINKSNRMIFVSQRKYILDLLGETGMIGYRAAETLIESNLKLEAAKPESKVDRERFQRGHFQVEVFTDADWAGSVTDMRSTSDYCTFVRGNLMTWRSKKQGVVARSSAEAEFRAATLGICEVIWIKRLPEGLKV